MLQGGLLNDLVFLALHPLNMLNLLSLHLVVIATLPVSLTLLIFGGVEGVELLIDSLDLCLDLSSFLISLVFLSICLFKLLSNFFHLFVEGILLSSDLLDGIPMHILLGLQCLDLRLNFLVSLNLWDGTLEEIGFFDKFTFCLGIH